MVMVKINGKINWLKLVFEPTYVFILFFLGTCDFSQLVVWFAGASPEEVGCHRLPAASTQTH